MRFRMMSFMLLLFLPMARGNAQTDSPMLSGAESASVLQTRSLETSSIENSSLPDSPMPDSPIQDRPIQDRAAETSSIEAGGRLPLVTRPKPDAGREETQAPFLPAGEDPENQLFNPFLKHLALDQKQFWTAPFHLHWQDVKFLVPFVAFSGGLIASDSWISRQVPGTTSAVNRSKKISDDTTFSLLGAAGAFYVWGHIVHNDRLRETGLLAGEAALNSAAVSYFFKTVTARPRPLDGSGNGTFFQGGASFPSEHCAVAWSVAGVIAHEYPGTLSKLAAYGLASAVTPTRVTGKQHFSSDVVVGSVLGWYFARQICRAHHDPELGGTGWGNLVEEPEAGDRVPNPLHMGSPYVPLDSWIYAAVEKLQSLGYITTAFLGSKPWSRIEIANMVSEAKDKLEGDEGGDDRSQPQIARIELQLEQEFSYELGLLDGKSNETAKVESVYARAVPISGPPLTDSYHFGQTIINNFGRPFEEGFNTYDGFSGYGATGPFLLYVRAEYQHAPSAPGYSSAVQDVIAAVDQTPIQPAAPVRAIDQLRLLDTYVATNAAGWQMSFGKQSLWWGPGKGGSLMLSDNAEPIYMIRASRLLPITLPWIFRLLGPMKSELFFGQQSGNKFPARPLLHGEKVSFKPTENLELGFSRTAEFGGVGRPLTSAAIFNSYAGFVSSADYGANDNPGKRTGSFNFSYRLPFLRTWLTLYADSITSDDPSPLDAPRRAAMSPGLYAPRLPGLPKLDLRVEAAYTDTPTSRSLGGQFFYWDAVYYRDLYLNKNNLIGSWIGREGVAYQAWTTYSFSPKNTLQFGLRHAQVDRDFIPGGVTLSDGSAKLTWWLRHDLSASSFVQYERWLAPLLAPTAQSNWTSSFQVTFWPKSWSSVVRN